VAAEAPQLLSRVRAALSSLQMLAEAPAGKPLDSTRVSGSSDADVGRVHSLYEKHVELLEAWCIGAEVDCNRFRFRAPKREPETQEQWEDRVIARYEGRPALEVSKLEGHSLKAIKALRMSRGRDPHTGRKLGP
jgi:hypothetical protein